MLKTLLTDNYKTLYCVDFTIYILFRFSVCILSFHILKKIVYLRTILLSKNLLSCKEKTFGGSNIFAEWIFRDLYRLMSHLAKWISLK